MKKVLSYVYLASPFFNAEQVERRNFILEELKKKGFAVYSPEHEFVVNNSCSIELKKQCFEANCRAIDNCVLVVAITNDKDMGTIWEAGYAFAKKKPILYFAENLEGSFNLMLAFSGNRVVTTRKEFADLKVHDLVVNTLFKGEIE